MFSKRLRRLLALGVVVGSLVTTASAPAGTVSVSPGGRVTGTAGAVQLVLNTARKTIACSAMIFTATLAPSSAGVYPLTIATDLTFRCVGTAAVTGPLPVTIACGGATLKATGLTAGGKTNVSITGINCTVTVNNSLCSVRITGGVTGSFDNATSVLTINTTGQSLSASGSSNGSGGTCALLPNDASIGFADSTGSPIRFAVTPTTTITAI
jgi:hypothetical protein